MAYPDTPRFRAVWQYLQVMEESSSVLLAAGRELRQLPGLATELMDFGAYSGAVAKVFLPLHPNYVGSTESLGAWENLIEVTEQKLLRARDELQELPATSGGLDLFERLENLIAHLEASKTGRYDLLPRPELGKLSERKRPGKHV